MTEKPIIFSSPMVRAILDGRKTQTRRVLKPQPDDLVEGQIPAALRISVGDLLWVRETWAPIYSSPPSAIYRADGEKQPGACCGCAWRPPIFMPREFSRITLRVTDVRVQRLQDISEEDAEEEGVFRHIAEHSINKVFRSERGPMAIRYFRETWDTINAKRGYPWENNPWVAAISFARATQGGENG